MNNEKIKAARKQLGGFFKARREEMGHSLETVADFVGISANTLHGVETGRFAWDIDLQHRICAALEIKPYFSASSDPMEEDYRIRRNDDPERYHGFYAADNILLHPNELAIIKLSHPRVFVRFNYGESLFVDYEDWKANHTDLQWLDPDDKPNNDDEVEEILTDCWNFLALTERKEEEIYGDDDE